MEMFIKTQKADTTKENYKVCLNKFFRSIQTDPDTYFKKKRDYLKDIWTFYEALKHNAPLTQRAYINILLNFFEENDVKYQMDKDEKRQFNKKIKRLKGQLKGSHAITLDDAPNRQELKKILSYGDLKARALFLLSASSGMRIGEILQLVPQDLKLDNDPPLITVRSRYTKSNRSRKCFMSYEARDLLKEWLQPQNYTDDNGIMRHESERDRYLRYACSKLKGVNKKNPDDKRVFPITDAMARKMWLNLIRKAGFTERYSETNRFIFHIHSLRKMYLSQIKKDIPHVVAEALAGHSRYLDEAYRRYRKEELEDFYKKGMYRVMIYEQPQDLTELKEDSKKKDEQIQKLQEDMKIMQLTMESLQNKYEIEKLKNGKK